jgi:acetyltransferase-like isoleucine patch superfamily enzyme
MLSAVKWFALRTLVNDTYATRALGVKVGEGCRIYTHRFGTEPWLVTIGNRVTVTAGCEFITHDGSTWLLRDEKGRRYRYAPIEVGDDVFIGLRTLILAGVRIGNRCIIGAGSVVIRSIPSGSIAAGVPARIIGRFDEYERRQLSTLASQQDMKGATYRERVEAILDHAPAPFLRRQTERSAAKV